MPAPNYPVREIDGAANKAGAWDLKRKNLKRPPLFPRGGSECPYYKGGKCGREIGDALPGLCKAPPSPGDNCILDDMGPGGIQVEGIMF